VPKTQGGKLKFGQKIEWDSKHDVKMIQRKKKPKMKFLMDQF
jgi:hypothetical protein